MEANALNWLLRLFVRKADPSFRKLLDDFRELGGLVVLVVHLKIIPHKPLPVQGVYYA